MAVFRSLVRTTGLVKIQSAPADQSTNNASLRRYLTRTPRRVVSLVQPVKKVRLMLSRNARRGKPNEVGSCKGESAQLRR